VHLWAEIVGRELAMLVMLLALGTGPASLLGRRFSAVARIAIAPALGLCVATCVFTTLIWFTAARNTYWLLPLLAVASAAFAVRRSMSSGSTWRSLRLSDALALAAVCVVVAAPLSYTLHERASVGPTGFLILDADGYTATADGMEQLSIRQAQKPDPEHASLVQKTWSLYARTSQNVDASPTAANLNLLLGLDATDTQSLFLIAFLVVAALGGFATVRYFAPKPGWTAPLAGVLFAGPLFLQLLADGSQAAICGLAVIMPLAAVGAETLRDRRLANLALLALLTSGLMALYPLYLPAVALASILVLATSLALRRRRGRLDPASLRRAALQIALLVALTIVFDLVSFTRDVHYWIETLGGENLANKPLYEMPMSGLPGWVLQTRQFYALQFRELSFLPDLAEGSITGALRQAVLPGAFILVILIGLWRGRRGLILVPLVLVFAALAEYASVAHHCPYCVDRDTLPSAPSGIVLLALGIAALATASRAWMRWAAVAVAVAAVLAAGQQTLSERQIFAAGSYFLGGGERRLVSDLPASAGPLELEGFGQNEESEQAVAELPLVYMLAYEHGRAGVSLPTEFFNYNSLAYLDGPNVQDPELTPDYRYVLTRLGGVQTARRVIARAGPLALEERTQPLDVTVTTGLALPSVRDEASGLPSVVSALSFLVTGNGTAPAWVLLRFRTIAPATVPRQPGVTAHGTAHALTVCVRAGGVEPVRRATVSLEGTLYAGPTPAEEDALPEPPQGITLLTMRVVGRCDPSQPTG
jgi:hypothetical protein